MIYLKATNQSLGVCYPITIEQLYDIHIGRKSEIDVLIEISDDIFFPNNGSIGYKARENWEDYRDIEISEVTVYSHDESHWLYSEELFIGKLKNNDKQNETKAS